jgi:hypothetical protein
MGCRATRRNSRIPTDDTSSHSTKALTMPMTDENAVTGQLLTRRNPRACGNLVNGYTSKTSRCKIRNRTPSLSCALSSQVCSTISVFTSLTPINLQPEINVISLMFKPRSPCPGSWGFVGMSKCSPQWWRKLAPNCWFLATTSLFLALPLPCSLRSPPRIVSR